MPKAANFLAFIYNPSPGYLPLGIVHALSRQYLRDAPLNPCRSGLGLLRIREVQNVTALPPGRQGMEGVRELAVLFEDPGELFRKLQLALRLKVDLQSRLLDGDGLLDIRPHNGFLDLVSTSELQSHRRLGVFPLTA